MTRFFGLLFLALPVSAFFVSCTEGHFDLGHNAGLGGMGGSLPPLFGEPLWIKAITSETNQDDATMTEDGLELYFASKREEGLGREDVWISRRISTSDAWGKAELVSVVNSEERETAPAVSPDGLLLWFSSDREGAEGGLDLWLAIRGSRDEDFGEPSHVTEFATADNDLARAPNATMTFLPRSSLSEAGDNDLSLVPLEAGPTYGTPVVLGELNSAADDTDPSLSGDGLVIVFASNRDEANGDLYLARRTSIEELFSAPIALRELNSAEEESDPWLSGDGKTLLFSSRRTGQLEVYQAKSLD